MANEFLLAEFSNLAATVMGQPSALSVNQMSGDPTLGDALVASANNSEMPSSVAHRVRQARAGTGNPLLDAQSYLTGALYNVGLLPPSGDPQDGALGIPGALLQAGIDAIDYTIENPVEVISNLSWPGTAVQVMDETLTIFGQHVPAIGNVLANMSPGTRTTILNDVLTGNFGGMAADAVTGVLLPNLAAAALGLLARQFGLNFGFRPPQPHLTEYYWPDDTGPVFTRTPPTSRVNVGHKGHMTVKLANIPFELPPATASVLPLHGAVQGQQPPGVEAGIRFAHEQNWAIQLIPGDAPVYQSMGLQGLMLEFVGAFLGWDHNRLLNQDLHNVGFHDPYNPDPLYTDPSRKGGAWQVSRVFLDNAVKNGTPVDFEIFSGVVRIKYQVVIKSYVRWYRDDARVYYKFVCFAVGGVEGGADAGTTLVQRATKANLKAQQKPVKLGARQTPVSQTGVLPKSSSAGAKPSATAAGQAATPVSVADPKPGSRVVAGSAAQRTDMNAKKAAAEQAVQSARDKLDAYISTFTGSAYRTADPQAVNLTTKANARKDLLIAFDRASSAITAANTAAATVRGTTEGSLMPQVIKNETLNEARQVELRMTYLTTALNGYRVKYQGAE